MSAILGIDIDKDQVVTVLLREGQAPEQARFDNTAVAFDLWRPQVKPAL